ncbi:MAG: putative chemotaxis regulator CheZ [Nitrospira sp. OLB3]|nr:MAG: putative chemotaxis regulator CheZ [Nitrospira sp. OLB3]RIK58972.1 MAG: hypothetical protein DCC63_08515 [Nitrospira sp.]
MMAETRGAAKPAVQVDGNNAEEPPDPNAKLYEELGELARFIDTTMKTLSEFSAPVNNSTQQLPQAMSHLTDLKAMTERGTHEVIRQVEAIQDNHVRLAQTLKDLTHALRLAQASSSLTDQLQSIARTLTDDDKRLIEIMTALSFQDLVAQSVNKLVTILDEVEHKLLQLVVVFGPYQKQVAQKDQGKASEMLKQLEATKSTSMNQDLVDEILKQFGFN